MSISMQYRFYLIACGKCAQVAGSYIKPRRPFGQRRRRSTVRYTEVAAGRVVEITAPGEAFVILSKEDFEGYKATVELLSHPENAKALATSLAEIEAKPLAE